MIRDAGRMDRPVRAGPKGKSGAISASPYGWLVSASAKPPIVIGFLAVGLGAAMLAPLTHNWLRGDRTVDSSRLRAATVRRGELIRDVHVSGKLVSASHPTLFAGAPGIVSLKVRPGERVAKGRILAVVESPTLESQLKQEKAKLHSQVSDSRRQAIASQQQDLTNRQQAQIAQVNFKAADRERRRAERSHAERLTTEYELSVARDTWLRAKLELEHAEQKITQHKKSRRFEAEDRRRQIERQQLVVTELERRVAELTIRSPVDGLAGEAFIEDRGAVDERGPVLKVVDLSVFEIDLEIPEAEAREVFVGAAAEIDLGARIEPGKVTRVSPSVTAGRVAGTASFVGDPPPGLRQNQRANVRILLERRPDVVMAPRGAYVDLGARFVYVLDDRMATRRAIEVGAMNLRDVEIVSGLVPGERIVLTDLSEFDGVQTILLY